MPAPHPQLREKLLQATLELVQTKGLAAFSLRQVAAAVGVSPSAVYRHFRDKEDLLTAIAEQGLTHLEHWQQHYAAQASEDPLSAFQAIGFANVRFAFEHPTHFKLLHNPVYARPDRSPRIAARQQAMQAQMDQLLDQGQVQGTLGPPPQVLLAAQAMTYGLSRMYVDGHLPGVERIETLMALADQAFEVLASGMVPREPLTPS